VGQMGERRGEERRGEERRGEERRGEERRGEGGRGKVRCGRREEREEEREGRREMRGMVGQITERKEVSSSFIPHNSTQFLSYYRFSFYYSSS
jgi:hypothetical protein